MWESEWSQEKPMEIMTLFLPSVFRLNLIIMRKGNKDQTFLVLFRSKYHWRLRWRRRRRRRRRTMACPTLRTSLRIAFYTTLVNPPLPSIPSVLNSHLNDIFETKLFHLKWSQYTCIGLWFFTFLIACCYINEWHLPSWSQFSGLYSVASLSYSTSAQYKVSSFHESK